VKPEDLKYTYPEQATGMASRSSGRGPLLTLLAAENKGIINDNSSGKENELWN
jgi:hypothetical protein